MREFELKKVENYLNKKFGSREFLVKERKSIDDSCEVYLGDEFLGLVYLEEDEGEIAYQFHMTILGEDLLEI
tara:strand:+ start:179 stop:394 length:216 start_codon:yes stop_codon:yes gene_type:complete